MPRTKRVSKKRNSSASTKSRSSEQNQRQQMVIADINRNFDAQMAKLDKQLESSILSLKHAYERAILQIPTSLLNKPPRLDDLEEVKRSPSPILGLVSTAQSCQPEHKMPPPSVPTRSRTRSSCKDSETESMPPPTNSRFRTPNCNIGAGGRYNLITPKVAPNSAMSILRRPCGGEMAFSMDGSPLLVSAITRDNMANVNVPLANGTVITLLPQTGLGPHVPQVDDETVQQLRRLKDNLASFLNQQL